jgi:hypothetical protein
MVSTCKILQARKLQKPGEKNAKAILEKVFSYKWRNEDGAENTL